MHWALCSHVVRLIASVKPTTLLLFCPAPAPLPVRIVVLSSCCCLVADVMSCADCGQGTEALGGPVWSQLQQVCQAGGVWEAQWEAQQQRLHILEQSD